MDLVPPVGSTDPAAWVDGDRSIGQKGSRVPHKAFTDANAEIVHAISQSGQTPDATKTDQLWQAIVSSRGLIFCTENTGTSTANARVLDVAEEYAPSDYADGMVIVWRSTLTNTGAVGVNVAGMGTRGLTLESLALEGGELATDQYAFAIYDGDPVANAFRMPAWAVASSLTMVTEDVTYIVGTLSGADFASLQAAHDSLSTKVLLPGVKVTFALQTQTHSLTGPVVFNHPQARQIEIIALDGLVTAPGSSGMTLSQTSGDLYSAAERVSDNAANETYFKSCFNAIIEFTSGSPSLIFETGLGEMREVMIDGNARSTNGIVSDDHTIDLQNVAIIDCANGVLARRLRINTNNVFVSGCNTGISMSRSQIWANSSELVVQGSTVGDGVSMNDGSRIVSSIGGGLKLRCCARNGLGMGWNSSIHAQGGANFIGNAEHGVWVIGNSSAYLKSLSAVHNGHSGVHCANGSFADVNSGNCTSNNYGSGSHTGIYAGTGATVFANSIEAGTTFSPALNAFGNGGAMIVG